MRAAWLNPTKGEANGSVELCVVVSAKDTGWIPEELRSQLTRVEQEHDLVIEMALYTRADAPQPDRNAIILQSHTNGQKNRRSSGETPSHANRDARALAISRLMAAAICRRSE